jgi:transcriptional regulator with XRE-family HTH domain
MAVLMREAIGGSLRRVRTARRRTLREVSRRARVSLGYLSEVERGRKEPSSELLAAICEALDIALPDLLNEAAQWLTGADATRPRRPLGLRHLDLRLANGSDDSDDSVTPSLPTALPLAPVGPHPVLPQPAAPQPVSAQPGAGQPLTGQPVPAQPDVAQPAAPQPVDGVRVAA